MVVAGLMFSLGLVGPVAMATAAPPKIILTAVEDVSAIGATLRAEINPNGTAGIYVFEYLSEAAYGGNIGVGREPFEGAKVAVTPGKDRFGSGMAPEKVSTSVGELDPAAAYRYRLWAVNTAGETAYSVARPLGTRPGTNDFELLDSRGWEMVSPIDISGGAIQGPQSIFGGGVYQAAADGGAITYSSADSFGAEAQGAPSGSQYVSVRSPGGWETANITTPLLTGSYGDSPDGVPYQLFSPTLTTSLLSNGERCRGKMGGGCPVANPPLPGSGAPPGYRD